MSPIMKMSFVQLSKFWRRDLFPERSQEKPDQFSKLLCRQSTLPSKISEKEKRMMKQ